MFPESAVRLGDIRKSSLASFRRGLRKALVLSSVFEEVGTFSIHLNNVFRVFRNSAQKNRYAHESRRIRDRRSDALLGEDGLEHPVWGSNLASRVQVRLTATFSRHPLH